MNLLIILILISVALLAAFLDVYSSAINNKFPQISESNKHFRLPNGRCDVPKLILFKVILLAACFALALILYKFAGAGVLAFAVFPMTAIVSIPAILKNFKLHRKYSRL